MLGSGKTLTHQELLEKLEDREVRQALEGKTTGKRKRSRGDQYAVYEADEDEVESDGEQSEGSSKPKAIATPMDVDADETAPQSTPQPAVTVDMPSTNQGPKVQETPSVGSALRRNADGSVVQPKVRQRMKGRQVCRLSCRP